MQAVMWQRGIPMAALAAVLAVSPLPAQQWTGVLSGAQETPANSSAGTGSVTLVLNGTLLDVQAIFSGLVGTTTVAHIHCCAALGSNASAASQTPTFFGFPFGVTAGSYQQLFDLSLAASWNASFLNANGGSPLQAMAVLVDALNSGNAYFNVHTMVFPGGELRAQMAPAQVPTTAPEPVSIVLLASGLGGIVAARRRGKRRSVAG
jgi:hypothetical protein